MWSRKAFTSDYNLYVIAQLVTIYLPEHDELYWFGNFRSGCLPPVPIPRVLWPEKPDGSNVSAETVLGLEGLTVASTFVGESYMAAGVFELGVYGLLAWVPGSVVDQESVLYHFRFWHFDLRIGFLCCRHHDAKSLLASGSPTAYARGDCDGLFLSRQTVALRQDTEGPAR